MRERLYEWLQCVWYRGARGAWALAPLSGLYWLVMSLRRGLYRVGMFKRTRVGAPVVVVGNITVGGTGKTPATVWLAAALRRRGFRPGIVSRGYGGSRSSSPMRVDEASDPADVGDEPVLLARRSGCPVAVDRDRVQAAGMLVDDGADVIIADDGLQHLALARDYEICIVDGRRWLGNGMLLPAGPLRERAGRLDDVDQVLVNGRRQGDAESAADVNPGLIEFELVATAAVRLDGSATEPLEFFAGHTVHAVAAIGNPERFFDMLRAVGIDVIGHPHPDHAALPPDALEFDDELDVLVTEKDAVKLDRRLAGCWYVPVDVHVPSSAAGPWLDDLEARLRARRPADNNGET